MRAGISKFGVGASAELSPLARSIYRRRHGIAPPHPEFGAHQFRIAAKVTRGVLKTTPRHQTPPLLFVRIPPSLCEQRWTIERRSDRVSCTKAYPRCAVGPFSV